MSNLSDFIGSAAKPPNITKFTATGTFTLPDIKPNSNGDKLLYIRHAIGSGGGAGGRSTYNSSPGAGGGHGQHFESFYLDVTSLSAGHVLNITINAIGSAGSDGSSGGRGTNGGDLVITDSEVSPNTLLTARGGFGGMGAVGNNAYDGIHAQHGTSNRAGMGSKYDDEGGRGGVPDIPGEYGRGSCSVQGDGTAADYLALTGYLEIHT